MLQKLHATIPPSGTLININSTDNSTIP